MILDKFHISLFNILEELIYMYDYKTQDVLFINNKSKNILNINNNIPLKEDIEYSDFFNEEDVLSKDIKKGFSFVNYKGDRYIINKNPVIYNNKSVVLCVCNKYEENLINEKKYMDIKDILIKCMSILSKDGYLFKLIYEILEMIGLYYNADRCYINEALTQNNDTYCYEWDRLKNDEETMHNQVINNDEIIMWKKVLGQKEILFIEDISFLKEIWKEKYDSLKRRKIKNIAIIIMTFLDNPIGFLCIENIEQNINDISVLKSLIYFILNEFKRRQISKKLTYINFNDEFTGLNNKNKYLNYIENVKYSKLKSIGVAYVDINGLKSINAEQGYEFGDRAIKELSETLKRSFRSEDIYRLEGDKFIIISENITKDTFEQKISDINKYFLELMEYSICIGYLWRDKKIDIKELCQKSDEYLCQAKRTYYDYIKNNNIDIYCSIATEEDDNDKNIKISLGRNTELDFSINKFSVQSKQDIFKFKIKHLIKKSAKKYMLVMLDINGFKVINEMYGFEEGNVILLKINQIINKFIFGKGICWHSYSDVYYFCCEAEDDDTMLRILSNIKNEITESISNIKILLSSGIYRINNKDIDIEDMIECVNYAHKISKKDTIKNVIFYDEALKINMLNEKEIENEMDKALERNEFKLYLQPKYNIKYNKIIGAEALVRWLHYKKGFILPSKFIPIFEKNGFIIKLDMYMLEQVCKFIKNNSEKGRENVPISVNISKINFMRKDLKQNVMEIINKYGVDPRLIELEITESLMAEDVDYIIKVIKEFKDENVIISMDDFGAGYSSLSMLQNLPVDVLKIDCGFFKNFEKTKKGAAIIKSIVMLAKELSLGIVAEGVELEEEVEYLREIECNNIQGYYFCKPIPVEEFEKKAFGEN